MAKRFTDTEKWNRPWFRSLPPAYKAFWEYLRDNCDHAGIWYVDMELASFMIGERIALEEARNLFAKQIEVISDGSRWFIKDFPPFQYGDLTPNNNTHRSVIATLKTFGLDGKTAPMQPLVSPCQGAMDKDKDKDGFKNPGKRGLERKQFDFEALWARYPNKDGKKEAKKHFDATVKTDADWQNINLALDNYLKSRRVRDGFVKNGSTWFNNWPDWVTFRDFSSSTASPTRHYVPPPVDESDLPTPKEAADFRAMAEAAIKGAKK